MEIKLKALEDNFLVFLNFKVNDFVYFWFRTINYNNDVTAIYLGLHLITLKLI